MVRNPNRLIVWIAIVIHGIDAINVVHVPIAVIVNAIARNLAGIAPHICAEVLVAVSHAGVEHRDHHVGAAST